MAVDSNYIIHTRWTIALTREISRCSQKTTHYIRRLAPDSCFVYVVVWCSVMHLTNASISSRFLHALVLAPFLFLFFSYKYHSDFIRASLTFRFRLLTFLPSSCLGPTAVLILPSHPRPASDPLLSLSFLALFQLSLYSNPSLLSVTLLTRFHRTRALGTTTDP